ncbi:MAG: phosphate butyryltransferase [Bacteroidales bacterium]|jgi:phosphate butyryltransferase|nr:phosphate butyryltransferase [Bacteroidales bacterium]MBR6971796.1 phosphate butyryltransferase [Bacteroidales bacterium]
MKTFDEVYELLKANPKRRLAVAWGVDEHSVCAASMAIDAGFCEATLYGDRKMIEAVCAKENIDINKFSIMDVPVELKAIQAAVTAVHNGEADVLMKGLCSTDKYMRGILNKEWGLLPPKAVLSHISVMQHPNYPKFLVFGDMAVIPLPDFKQKTAILKYIVNVCKSLGVANPKIAAVAATEQMLDGMPACVEAAMLAKMADRGQLPGQVDGPLALDVAINKEAAAIKKLKSEVAGDADGLLFPNIESGNVFYKSNTMLVPGVRTAAFVAGASAPCVLSSRADSIDTKLNSIALACLQVK